MDEAIIRIIMEDAGAAVQGASAPSTGVTQAGGGTSFGTTPSVSIATEQFRQLTSFLQELPEIRKAVGWTAEIMSGVRQAQTDRIAPGMMMAAGAAGGIAATATPPELTSAVNSLSSATNDMRRAAEDMAASTTRSSTKNVGQKGDNLNNELLEKLLIVGVKTIESIDSLKYALVGKPEEEYKTLLERIKDILTAPLKMASVDIAKGIAQGAIDAVDTLTGGMVTKIKEVIADPLKPIEDAINSIRESVVKYSSAAAVAIPKGIFDTFDQMLTGGEIRKLLFGGRDEKQPMTQFDIIAALVVRVAETTESLKPHIQEVVSAVNTVADLLRGLSTADARVQTVSVLHTPTASVLPAPPEATAIPEPAPGGKKTQLMPGSAGKTTQLMPPPTGKDTQLMPPPEPPPEPPPAPPEPPPPAPPAPPAPPPPEAAAAEEEKLIVTYGHGPDPLPKPPPGLPQPIPKSKQDEIPITPPVVPPPTPAEAPPAPTEAPTGTGSTDWQWPSPVSEEDAASMLLGGGEEEPPAAPEVPTEPNIEELWEEYEKNPINPTVGKSGRLVLRNKHFQNMIDAGAMPADIPGRGVNKSSKWVTKAEWEAYLKKLRDEGKEPPSATGFARGGLVGDAAYMADGGIVGGGGVPEHIREKLKALAVHPDYFDPKWLGMATDAAMRAAQDEAVTRGFNPTQASIIGHAVANYVLEHGTKPTTIYKRALLRAKDAGASDEDAMNIARNVMDYQLAQQQKADPLKGAPKSIDELTSGMSSGGIVYAAEGGEIEDYMTKVLRAGTAVENNQKIRFAADEIGVTPGYISRTFQMLAESAKNNPDEAADSISDAVDSIIGLSSEYMRKEKKEKLHKDIEDLFVEKLLGLGSAQTDVDWRPAEMLPEDYYMAGGGEIASHPGGPQGTDTVPAWLTPGEVVVPADMVREGAVDHLRGSLPGFARGGVVRYAADGGASDEFGEAMGRALEQEEIAAFAAAMEPDPAKADELRRTIEDFSKAIGEAKEDLEELSEALVDVVAVVEPIGDEESIPVGKEIFDQGGGSGGFDPTNLLAKKGANQNLLGSITKGSNIVSGIAKGDAGAVMGQMGGAASAVAGPVMAIKAAVDAVNAKVIGGIRDTVDAISGVANAIADPSADPSVPLRNIGDAASKAGEKIANISPALGWLTVAIGETTSAVASFMNTLNKTAERYGEFSPQIAQAQAIAEIRHTMGDIRRANEVSASMSKFIMAQSDLQQKFEDIKVKMLVKIVPIATRILEIIEMAIPSGQGIESAINTLGGPLVLLANIASEMVGLKRQEIAPEPEDPTSNLLDPRFMMTEGMNDARGRPGWVPER